MATLAFDTHAFVKELTQAGMPEAQAEVLARSQATLIDEKLATKQDLKELEARLRHDMKELELRLTIRSRRCSRRAGDCYECLAPGRRMSTLVFDTHTFVKELTQAGMPEAQAEVLARSQATLIDEKLATKQLDVAPRLDDGRRHRRGRRVGEAAVSIGSAWPR